MDSLSSPGTPAASTDDKAGSTISSLPRNDLAHPSKLTSVSHRSSGGSPVPVIGLHSPSSPGATTPAFTTTPSIPPERSSSQISAKSASSKPHRLSFVENLRSAPTSPRSQRQPSFAPAALQELLNHPPTQSQHANPRFSGRDWRDVMVGELVSAEDVKWAEMSTSVEDATKILVRNTHSNIVLVRRDDESSTVLSAFDYNDLNAYLLAVVGLLQGDAEHQKVYDEISAKARQRQSIPLAKVLPICRKESLVSLASTDNLARAIETLGGGIHQALVLDSAGVVIGILSQLRLVEFFWSEGVHFTSIDCLYPVRLRELGIGTQNVVCVNSDSPLQDALLLMHEKGLTSVAVVDNGYNVAGNISTVDVRLLTSTAQAPLLYQSCMHFISVCLTERGVELGKDPFPVLYVNPDSTLAHTVAKLVATQSHRMWIVDDGSSPSTSAPSTPVVSPMPASSMPFIPGLQLSVSAAGQNSVPASALPGAQLSGRLCGVVSLTDILNVFARSSGLQPTDPSEQRARRRRSSSSSDRSRLMPMQTGYI